MTHALTHAAEPSAAIVFGHVQVVGLGMAQRPVAVNGAQSSTQSFKLHPPAQIGSSSLVLAMAGAGAAGARDWVRASRTEPVSHTIPALAESVTHLIITSS